MEQYTVQIYLVIFAMLIMCLLVGSNDLIEKQKKKDFMAIFIVIIVAAMAEWCGRYLDGAGAQTRFLHITVKAVDHSLAPVVTGRIRPGLRQVWKSMAFLVAVAIPVGVLNRLLHTNYMFLGHPSAGSPLELLGNIPGRYGYLAGYFLLVLAVEIAMNLPWSIFTRRRQCKM